MKNKMFLQQSGLCETLHQKYTESKYSCHHFDSSVLSYMYSVSYESHPAGWAYNLITYEACQMILLIFLQAF